MPTRANFWGLSMTSNRICRIVRALLVVPAMVSTGAFAPAPLKCRAADARSLGLIRELREWVTTADPERIASRDTIFHIPVVPASQITLVTDERVCAKVVQAYARYPAHTPDSLYVIKMRSRGYVGFDPDRKGGEFTAVYIFNSKYAHVGGWVG
jgi:hypothetical protein